MAKSIPITSKTSATSPGKKMNKDIVGASMGNNYDHTTSVMRAIAGAKGPDIPGSKHKKAPKSEEQIKSEDSSDVNPSTPVIPNEGDGGGEKPKTSETMEPVTPDAPVTKVSEIKPEGVKPMNTDDDKVPTTIPPPVAQYTTPAKDEGHGTGPDKPSTQPDKHTHVYNEKGQRGSKKNIPAVKGVKGVKGEAAIPKTSLTDAYKNADKTKYPDFESFKVAAKADPLYGTSGADEVKEVKEVKGVDERNEFVLDQQVTPGTETVKEGKPDAYVSSAFGMRQNVRAINKYDKNQAKQVKKLNKKRDGKGFLGFQRRSEKTKDEVVRTKKDGTKVYGTGDADYLNLLDKQKKQRIDETRPEGSGTDIFRYGLDNKGVGGKATGGTPSSTETTDASSDYINWNKERDGVQPAYWDTKQNKMVPNPEYQQTRLSDSMVVESANPVPAAVYHPEKIKIGNSKSYKMKGMKFKG